MRIDYGLKKVVFKNLLLRSSVTRCLLVPFLIQLALRVSSCPFCWHPNQRVLGIRDIWILGRVNPTLENWYHIVSVIKLRFKSLELLQTMRLGSKVTLEVLLFLNILSEWLPFRKTWTISYRIIETFDKRTLIIVSLSLSIGLGCWFRVAQDFRVIHENGGRINVHLI